MAETAERRAAVLAIGKWPGNTMAAKRVAAANGTMVGSFSHRHAEQVWRDGLASVYVGAKGMGTRAGPAAPLAMVAALASHLGGCERCWRTGPYGSDTPVAWLMWAAARNEGMAAVLGPIVSELAGAKLDRSLARLRTGAAR